MKQVRIRPLPLICAGLPFASGSAMELLAVVCVDDDYGPESCGEHSWQ